MWFLPICVSLVMFRNMLKMNRNIHQTHLRAGRVGPESTYMMALGKTPQCVPDRRRWKTLVEPKVKRRAGLTGNYSNLCEFIYFTIRKNKERGSSSASKASLETVLPSRKTNPLFLTLDKFWSSRNESRDEKPVQMAFYPQAREIKFFRNYISWLFVPNSSSVQWKPPRQELNSSLFSSGIWKTPKFWRTKIFKNKSI